MGIKITSINSISQCSNIKNTNKKEKRESNQNKKETNNNKDHGFEKTLKQYKRKNWNILLQIKYNRKEQKKGIVSKNCNK